MRILYVLSEFPSTSQTFVLGQITGMIARGHDVWIYARKGGGRDALHRDVEKFGLLERTTYPDARGGLRPQREVLRALAGSLGWGVQRRAMAAVGKRLRRGGSREWKVLNDLAGAGALGRFDIVHCQVGTLAPAVIELRRLGLISGRVVTSLRGDDVTRYPREHPDVYDDVFRLGECFLPVSRNLQERAAALGAPAARMEIHPSGIDVSRFHPRPRNAAARDAFEILSVGRLVEKKGLEDALHAIARLRDADHEIHYSIIGDGPLRARLEQTAQELGLVDRVVFWGAKGSDDVIAAMQRADLLVAPSVTARNGDQEGIPNVLKEAMALALPVVSTRHAGIPDLISDGTNGLLVGERDREALAAAITRVITQPEAASRMGAAARATIERDFDIEVLNDRLDMIYREVASASRD